MSPPTSSVRSADTRSRLKLVAIGYEGNPSMRLRVQQYQSMFQADGIELTTVLLPQVGHGRPRRYGSVVWRAVAEADVVLVQRALYIWLNIVLRASRRPVVFDVDDFVHYIRLTQLDTTVKPRGVKDRSRVIYRRFARGSRYYSSRKRLLAQMLSLCRAAIVGNRFLQDEIAGFASCPTVVLPTSVPADPSQLKRHDPHVPITIGWVGLRNNLLHLRMLEPAFRALADRFGNRLRLHVVTSHPYESDYLPTDFSQWSLEREGDLVKGFDIGLMPLIDDPFSRGKSAFKAILCMSYGVPVVISPVGVNADLVKDGWNGFLASSPAEWESAITRLAEDHELRTRIGFNAFQTIERGFSTERAYSVLKSVVERAARGERIDERPPMPLFGAHP